MARPLGQRLIWRGLGELQSRARPLLRESFDLDERRYPLFLSRRGEMWRHERVVEVAIMTALLDQAVGKRILEVGAVLHSYAPITHTVVDKYEVSEGVINEDAEIFEAEPFDLILSISTIEHIGWDEDPRDPGKIPRVIEHLRGLLTPGGSMTITVPAGYNRDLDDLLAADALPFDRISYLARRDFLNHWEQVDRSVFETSHYGYPFVAASAIAVATLARPIAHE